MVIAPGIDIRRLNGDEDISTFKNFLSSDELLDAQQTPLWLRFEWDESDEFTTSETINLVLLSLWLVKPNRVEAKLKFCIGKDQASGEKSRQRLLDRMQWIALEEAESFSTQDIALASTLFFGLCEVYRRRGRLSNAMILTMTGCWSHYWQAALISHAAAIEAILTYSTEPGITRRLATSFASLVEDTPDGRRTAKEHFIELYNIRSDAMHGRVHNLEEGQRLPSLSSFQGLLRDLWKVILANVQSVEALEGDDAERREFFERLQ